MKRFIFIVGTDAYCAVSLCHFVTSPSHREGVFLGGPSQDGLRRANTVRPYDEILFLLAFPGGGRGTTEWWMRRWLDLYSSEYDTVALATHPSRRSRATFPHKGRLANQNM